MAIITQGHCHITGLNQHGLGIAHIEIDNKVLISNSTRSSIANKSKNLKKITQQISIPFTLPNEIVDFEYHKYRYQTNTILKNVVQPSKDRVQAPCQYFGTCGGCLLQHMNEEAYRNYKYKLFYDQIRDIILDTTIIENLIAIPPGHRRRANLKVIKKNEHIYLGFYRYHTHQIINIDNCLILNVALTTLIKPLKHFLYYLLNDKQKAQIYITEALNGLVIDIDMEQMNDLNKHMNLKINEFIKKNNVISLTINSNQQHIFTTQIEVPYIKFAGVLIKISARCFLQTSQLSDEILADLVIKYIKTIALLDNHKAIDLFSGRGTFTIPLAHYIPVTAYESDVEAVEALLQASRNARLKIDALQRDLFIQPVTTDELNAYNICIINPPRTGAQTQIQQLADSKISYIVYISCNLESFNRDAKILMSKGNFQLQAIKPVDQFYYNSHMELVAFFTNIKIL